MKWPRGDIEEYKAVRVALDEAKECLHRAETIVWNVRCGYYGFKDCEHLDTALDSIRSAKAAYKEHMIIPAIED